MAVKFAIGFVIGIGLAVPYLLRAEEPKAGDAKMTAVAPDDKAANSDSGKLKGRLPLYFSKLDVTSEQRQKIYKIQAAYAAKMDTLEKQLEDLKTQCNVEARAVLTSDQQAKLDELLGERKLKKAKDAKLAGAKDTAPAAGESNKVTESAAK